MKITTRHKEGVTILELHGKLTIGDGDVKLRKEVEDVIDRGARKLLLNVKGLKTVDSSGFGELWRCLVVARQHEAVVKLLHVEGKIQEVLEMTRMIVVFDTFDDEIDAIASFCDS